MREVKGERADWFELAVTQISTLYKLWGAQNSKNHNTPNLEVDRRQQEKTTSDSAPVSQEQETEDSESLGGGHWSFSGLQLEFFYLKVVYEFMSNWGKWFQELKDSRFTRWCDWGSLLKHCDWSLCRTWEQINRTSKMSVAITNEPATTRYWNQPLICRSWGMLLQHRHSLCQ